MGLRDDPSIPRMDRIQTQPAKPSIGKPPSGVASLDDQSQGLNGDVSALGFTAQSGIEPMGSFLEDQRKLEEDIRRKQAIAEAQPTPATDYGKGPGHNTSKRRGSTRRRRTTGLGYGLDQNW